MYILHNNEYIKQYRLVCLNNKLRTVLPNISIPLSQRVDY